MKTVKTVNAAAIKTKTERGKLLSVKIPCVLADAEKLLVSTFAGSEYLFVSAFDVDGVESTQIAIPRKRALKLAKLLTIMAKQLPKE